MVFYKLLIIICKLCIAKHDEALLSEAIRKSNEELGKLNGDCDALIMRSTNLKNILPSLADGSNLASLVESTKKVIDDLK